jgi:hypothetical protein
VAHLATADRSALRVSAADKLHNARAIVADLRRVGPAVWDRFNPDAGRARRYASSSARTSPSRSMLSRS